MSRSPRRAVRDCRSATSLGGAGSASHDRVLECAARIALRVVRPLTSEQLVQNDAERVDVRRDGERLAENLLGRSVLGRQRAAGELGELGPFGLALVEQLGNPEVQQPDLAVARDQNIRGFQIAMHDELRVRVGDTAGDLREQPQPRLQVELLLAAILVDLTPFDVLDREKRPPFRRETRVVQPRDIRMRQCGENPPLARHALREPCALPRPMRKLQCNRPVDQPVAPLGEPHRAHAAVAQLAQQAIGSHLVAGLIAAGVGSIGIAEHRARISGGCRGKCRRRLDRRATAGHAAEASRLRTAERASPSTPPAATPVDRGPHPATDSARPRCARRSRALT